MRAEGRARWLLFGLVAVVGLALDIYTKHLVVDSLRVGEMKSLLGNWLQITLIYNKGAIFGMDPRAISPQFPTNGFFYVFSIVALVVLVLYYKNLRGEGWLPHWGVAVITPGALGNLFDRLVYPDRGVVDFVMVNLGFRPFNPWPIFNFADIYITVGVGIILLGFMRDSLARKAEANSREAGTPA